MTADTISLALKAMLADDPTDTIFQAAVATLARVAKRRADAADDVDDADRYRGLAHRLKSVAAQV